MDNLIKMFTPIGIYKKSQILLKVALLFLDKGSLNFELKCNKKPINGSVILKYAV